MNRREVQRTYPPGALFIPRSTGLPGQFNVCMIIGWLSTLDKEFDNVQVKFVTVKSWSAIVLYSENGQATVGKLTWRQIAEYCNLLDDFVLCRI